MWLLWTGDMKHKTINVEYVDTLRRRNLMKLNRIVKHECIDSPEELKEFLLRNKVRGIPNCSSRGSWWYNKGEVELTLTDSLVSIGIQDDSDKSPAGTVPLIFIREIEYDGSKIEFSKGDRNYSFTINSIEPRG